MIKKKLFLFVSLLLLSSFFCIEAKSQICTVYFEIRPYYLECDFFMVLKSNNLHDMIPATNSYYYKAEVYQNNNVIGATIAIKKTVVIL